MPEPLHRPENSSSSDGAGARERLARKWAYLLSGVVVIPLTKDELDRELRELLDAVCAALVAEPFSELPLEEVGKQLVNLGYVGEDGLRRTVEVLGKGLLGLPEFHARDIYSERIVLGIGAVATGFLAASRLAVFEQQERMQLSLLKAVRDAKWNLRESEARFNEVVGSSSSGILIVGLDGRIVRANAAITQILGHTPEELAGLTLYDLVHPDTAGMLRQAMTTAVAGGQDRVRQSQRLLRRNGDVARISLTASLLRDADGAPGHFVTVIEDGTELMLLQSELNRQALHDVLTGLPNRQFFGTHLESALRRADPQRGVTLLHLDLDAFGMLCNSLGRRAGERLLVHVAQRLKAVVAREKAMVARFDGDEFGILVENTAATPDIATIAAEVNRELAEPIYIDDHGIAVSASIGVAQSTSRDHDPDDLLRDADQALRRAKTGRRGQWELHDPTRDTADRTTHTLAVSMPGAWEQGHITTRYRPIRHLTDNTPAGVEAVLHWNHPDHGPITHHRCVELAERTGLILPLGEWLLRTAAEHTHWWRRRTRVATPLSVALTHHQATDADLVSRVIRALDHTTLPRDQVTIGIPTAAATTGEAADNLTVLADLGLRTALTDFGLGPHDLATAHDLPIHTVRITPRLVDLQTQRHATYAAALIPHLGNTTIHVDGIQTAAQATWWRDAGAHIATGPHYGQPSTTPPA